MVKLPRVDFATRRVPDAGELAALAAATPAPYRLAVWLGAVLGLRWSEVAGLRVGRIDLKQATLTVAEAVTRGPGGVPALGPPKSHAGRRTLALPGELCHLVADHLAARGLTPADADRFVLEAPGGGPLRYENFRTRVWAPSCRAAGLDGLGFHDLRRASATALVLENVDLKTAQTRLGHSDPRLTLGLYAQATSAADRAAAEALAGRFFARRAASTVGKSAGADRAGNERTEEEWTGEDRTTTAGPDTAGATVVVLSRHGGLGGAFRLAPAKQETASSREFAGGGDILRSRMSAPLVPRKPW